MEQALLVVTTVSIYLLADLLHLYVQVCTLYSIMYIAVLGCCNMHVHVATHCQFGGSGMCVYFISVSLAGVKAMCKVWHEVTLELRYRWENGIRLPE